MQLGLTPPNIWFYTNAVDFCKLIDGLVALVTFEMEASPADEVFMFHSGAKDNLKTLAWYGNGFVPLYKGLEKRKFTRVCKNYDEQSVALKDDQLSWLLAGLN